VIEKIKAFDKTRGEVIVRLVPKMGYHVYGEGKQQKGEEYDSQPSEIQPFD
jgi:hypothetical protein